VLRLRLLRALLPLLLALLALLLWYSWNPRGSAARRSTSDPGPAPARAEGLAVKEFSDASGAGFEARADVFEPREDGTLHLEGIEELEIPRKDRGPIVVSAAIGDRQGAAGHYGWLFDKDVVFGDPETGLTLHLPSLEIDGVQDQARSSGDIRFEVPEARGRATAIVYGLSGQPRELSQPVIEDSAGGRLTAARAQMLDGIREVELVGDVRMVREDQNLGAERIRLLWGLDKRLRQAVASGGVGGSWRPPAGSPAVLAGDRLEVRWSATGEIEHLALTGNARFDRGAEVLAASSIEAVRVAAFSGESWRIAAREAVFVQGSFGSAPGRLRAESLWASTDATLSVREAEASGSVIFEGQETSAEAEQARFVADRRRGGTIDLVGDDLRKARLAQARTRVAARTIRTDPHGRELSAEGLVEATLLAADATGAPEPSPRTRLFFAEQPLHFVSEQLKSRNSGERLEFRGAVRAWQGERHLAAGSVILDQRTRKVEARDAVSTRIPRESGRAAAAEADYLQIGADRLDYDDSAGIALYQGQVRVRLHEGWLEAERVEVDLGSDSREIQEIRAAGTVRIEFQRVAQGASGRPVSGTADRLVYRPADATVQLLGDRSPASVRRFGDGGGTSTGRVLTYRVDTGTLNVDSGEQAPGRIRS